MTMDYIERFDVIVLIYCDYGALSITDRLMLLKKIYQALRPNGKFILDVFTPLMRKSESRSWQYHEKGGFFIDEPHICLEAVYQYDDEDNTELRQTIVVPSISSTKVVVSWSEAWVTHH